MRRTAEGADDVDQPLPLPGGVSDLAVGITSGDEPGLLWVCAIALALLGCVGIVRAFSSSGGDGASNGVDVVREATLRRCGGRRRSAC